MCYCTGEALLLFVVGFAGFVTLWACPFWEGSAVWLRWGWLSVGIWGSRFHLSALGVVSVGSWGWFLRLDALGMSKRSQMGTGSVYGYAEGCWITGDIGISWGLSGIDWAGRNQPEPTGTSRDWDCDRDYRSRPAITARTGATRRSPLRHTPSKPGSAPAGLLQASSPSVAVRFATAPPQLRTALPPIPATRLAAC